MDNPNPEDGWSDDSDPGAKNDAVFLPGESFCAAPPNFRSVDGFPRSILQLLANDLTPLGEDYQATFENYALEAIYEVILTPFFG